MIHACVCEKGWEGVACNKRTCPKGDDPTTAGGKPPSSSSAAAAVTAAASSYNNNAYQKRFTKPPVDKIQLIDCQCAQCAGGIYLTYENFQTPLIPYDASEELIW